MATKGLERIWGFEQLDRASISTLNLGIVLLGGSALVGLLALAFVHAAAANSILASYWTLEVVSASYMLSILLLGASLFTSILLARTTESDIRQLLQVDLNIDESYSLLRPKLGMMLPAIALSAGATILVVPLLASLRLDISIMDSLIAFYSSGVSIRLLAFVLSPLMGMTIGIGLSVGIGQILSLIYIARRINIDLVRLSHYSAIANPGIRLFIIETLVFSVFPLVAFSFNDPIQSTGILRVGIIMAFCILPVILLYFYPVLILRNRIRDKKQQELDAVHKCLNGNDHAIESISLRSRGVPTTTQDFLTHQMFIESRWEWPIAAHIQKLILFGLLPPLTWMLAAMIENTMY